LIGIVIVAHGGLAREYLRAVEHVVGQQAGIVTVEISYDHDRAVKETEICTAANIVDKGSGVVIVTDMFGGSPSNLSLAACNPANRMILYGANLPLLIKLAKTRSLPLKTAVLAARDAGRKYMDARTVGQTGYDS
jgi:PTS system mannose-specific IIA component